MMKTISQEPPRPKKGQAPRKIVVLKPPVAKRSERADAPLVSQEDLETQIYRRIHLEEIERTIAVALSSGAKVEEGVHQAKLVPVRKNGKQYLRLVVR